MYLTTVSNRDLGIRNEHTKNMIDQSLLMLRESKFINIQIILEGLFFTLWKSAVFSKTNNNSLYRFEFPAISQKAPLV